ncbi:nucleobindin-2 isoform X2 [Pectinophora gossypiella]|uniref:nucleobindin-2 isoform X2 n=1 Tax=Pectinophora gossypiella TaxID=13191 RepID=UPI00214ED00A|nr:nucleobindin-2 isoform X2 [Pectinophora gossypiella]
MKLLPSLLCFLVILHCSYAPPVSPDKPKEQDSEIKDDLEEYMEYHRYLKEVVQALESDPDFRERLEKADEEDVRSGKIAEQLDFVNHNVRTKLDEIKRRELERLRHLATKQFEIDNNLDTTGKVPTNEHLDHANPNTFEIEDLKKLIKKTTADLEAADKQRKEQFKEYEMQKEFEKHQKMENMDEPQKKEYMDNLKKEEDAKKHHQPLRHPVTREQLLEIWKNADKMDAKDFDPKVFFMMHDVDGNGVWDADEVKALFIKELDKLYGPGGPNKDLHERAEEMERMREHVFKENDRNRDGLIDFNEFMLETQKSEFNQDEGWKSIDENQIYTQQEYQEFERRRLEELRYLQQRGLVDAHGRPIPGAEHQIHQAQKQFHQLYTQHQQQYLQGQYPGQQFHGQAPPGYPQGQMPPQYQQAPQGYPQGQFQQQPVQGQQPPQQFQGQQPPQGHYQGQQPPQGQYQGQQPPQQFQGQQPPQGQYQGQQQPQGQYQGQQPPQGQFQGQQAPQGQYPGQPQQGQFQGQPPQGQYQAPPAQAQPGQQQQGNNNQGQAPPVQQAQAVKTDPQTQGQVSPNQGQQGQPINQAPAQPQQGQPPAQASQQASSVH